MNLPFKALKTLAHRGHPLELTVDPDPHDPTKAYRIDTADGRSCTIRQPLSNQELDNLRSALKHYPDDVTINGEPVETTPFPDLARAHLTSYPDNDDRAHGVSYFPDLPSHHTPGNAFVAGVCTYISVPDHDFPFRYHTPATGGNDFWTKANEVSLHPFWVITSTELELFQNPLDKTLKVEKNAPIHTTLMQRATAQLERTLLHPALPPRHQGQIHRYLLEPEHDTSHFRAGAPIIISGTPIQIDDCMDRPLTVTFTQALYAANQKFVPVAEYQGRHNDVCEHYFATYLGHQRTPPAHDSAWAIDKADVITLTFQVEEHPGHDDSEVITLHTPFLLDGDPWHPKVSYVPGRISKEDLAQAMELAYWQTRDHASWDDLKDDLNANARRMHQLVSAALDNPDHVFQEALQRHADAFESEIPQPSRPLTVLSKNGRLSITYNPS